MDLVSPETIIAWIRAFESLALCFIIQATKDSACFICHFPAFQKSDDKLGIVIMGIPRIVKCTLAQPIAHLDHVEAMVSPP
jgi:hypothetical protein